MSSTPGTFSVWEKNMPYLLCQIEKLRQNNIRSLIEKVRIVAKGALDLFLLVVEVTSNTRRAGLRNVNMYLEAQIVLSFCFVLLFS